MYTTKKDLLGYVLKVKKFLIDLEDVSVEDLINLNDLDFCITFFIGVRGMKFVAPPQEPKLLFQSVDTAVNLKKDHSGETNTVYSVEPVYDLHEEKLQITRMDNNWIPEREMMTRPRSKRYTTRKDKFKNYNNEENMLTKYAPELLEILS